MTLLENMADYQQPPAIIHHDHPQNGVKKRETVEMQKLKRRYDRYKNRDKDMKISDRETTAALYQLSSEETKRYFEKVQQNKAKKSNKRQRDSTSSAAGQLKRKLSTGKTDGPAAKQHNTEKNDDINADDIQELFDFDFPDTMSPKNLKEIMTMLEESDASNASAPDAVDKTANEQKHQQNGMYQSPPSRQQSINNNATQPQQPKSHAGQQPPHPNNTPSPRVQHNVVPPNQHMPPGHPAGPYQNPSTTGAAHLQHMTSTQPGYPAPPNAAATVKHERLPPAASQYNRSNSESAMQHHIRQAGMPMEYSRAGTYPTAGGSVPHPTPEYVRQMSTPNPPTGSPYYPHGQMPAGAPGHPGRGYPAHGAPAPGYTGYPASHYPAGHHPAHLEEIRRMQMADLAMREKAQLSRSISHPVGMTMDLRGVPHGYYPPGTPVMSADPAMQHHAALRANPQHPSHSMHPSAASHYMQSRPGYPPGAQHLAAQAMPPHGAQASMMSRGLPAHPHQPGSLPHEHSTSYAAKSSHLAMQHAGAMGRPTASFPVSVQQQSIPGAYPASHPVSHHPGMRPMNTANPAAAASAAMMSQSAAAAAAHMHHHNVTSRSSSNPAQQVPTTQPGMQPGGPMMTNPHPSMNPHAVHRPPSAGQQAQMMPHTTSPPHPQQARTPQQAVQQQYTQQQQQQRNLQHAAMHPQHMQQSQQQAQQSLQQSTHPQHSATSQHPPQHPSQHPSQHPPQHPSQHQQQHQMRLQAQQGSQDPSSTQMQEDLIDLEMILSGNN